VEAARWLEKEEVREVISQDCEELVWNIYGEEINTQSMLIKAI